MWLCPFPINSSRHRVSSRSQPVFLPHQNKRRKVGVGGVGVCGGAGTFSRSVRAFHHHNDNWGEGNVERVGGGKVSWGNRQEVQTPDWLPAFGCCLLIGCCDVPQFGGFHSLTVGDLGLMTLTTVDGRNNKISTISFSLPDGNVKYRVDEPMQKEKWENWPYCCFGGACYNKSKASTLILAWNCHQTVL